MGNSKPQVIIDLDEYNELLGFKSKIEKNEELSKEDVKPYQKALGSILRIVVKELSQHYISIIMDAPKTADVEMNVSKDNGFFTVLCKNKPTS